MTFGEKIKALRKERGMTQKDLAEALGLSLRTISNYETGGLRPRHDATYDALAELFHVPKTYFFTEEDAFISAAEARWGKTAPPMPGNWWTGSSGSLPAAA